MSRTVRFSFDTDEERDDFVHYANQKGMSLSALAKMALYQYRAKYPQKEAKNDVTVVFDGVHYPDEKTVQPQRYGGTCEKAHT